MSKGLKSIFIFDAFPSYQHTEHQAKILSLTFSFLRGRGKTHNVVRLSQDPFFSTKIMKKRLQPKTIFTQAETNQFSCSKAPKAFPLLYNMWFLGKALCLLNTLLYKAYGLQV